MRDYGQFLNKLNIAWIRHEQDTYFKRIEEAQLKLGIRLLKKKGIEVY